MAKRKKQSKDYRMLLAIADVASGKEVNCPFCGGELDVKLYANEDRIGFATAVCKQCGKKEYVSRMRFNENAKTLPF